MKFIRSRQFSYSSVTFVAVDTIASFTRDNPFSATITTKEGAILDVDPPDYNERVEYLDAIEQALG